MNKIIGLSGVAGSGKDLFYELLSKRIKCERYALADALKEEVSDWCSLKYEICPMHCSRDDKSLIRPFLVFHGKMKRVNSNGRYWIEKLQEKITWWKMSNPFPEQADSLTVITDIRYNEYEKDEVYWLKKELEGSLIHISQYEEKEIVDKRNWPNTKTGKVFREPANEDETKWDPILKSEADFRVEWPRVRGENANEELLKYVDKFLVDFNK